MLRSTSLMLLAGMCLLCGCRSTRAQEADPIDPEVAPHEGLLVRHQPLAADAPRPAGPHPFTWHYRTSVRNERDFPLRIVSFECFVQADGEWVSANPLGRRLETADFVRLFHGGDAVTDGWLLPGKTAVAPTNWHAGRSAESRPVKWGFWADDGHGGQYYGEAEYRPRPLPKPADNTASQAPLAAAPPAPVPEKPGPEGYEARLEWVQANWSLPLVSRVVATEPGEDRPTTRQLCLQFRHRAGEKAALYLPMEQRSLPVQGRLEVDVYLTGDTARSLAPVIITTDGGYQEAPARELEPGWNRKLQFGFRAPEWKSEATEWQHQATAQGLDRVVAIGFVLPSPEAPGESCLFFDRLLIPAAPDAP